uniref:CASP-like protein n=1 Tax=Leersia perrieri TaxID=77586 RepID=A0A0D9V3E1_9ORYZ
MAETPRTPAPERPPPPVPVPDSPQASPSPPPVPDPPPASPPPQPLLPESAPSTPREEYHTPPPSLDEARDESLVGTPRQVGVDVNGGSEITTKSPQLSPVRLHLSPHRLLPPAPGSPAVNGFQDGANGTAPPAAPPGRRRGTPPPQLHVPMERLVRTPSQGSLAMSSPSPSPTPPSPLTPAPAPATATAATPTAKSKSGQATPKQAEAWKPPASLAATAIAMQFDPVEEAITSPLRIGNGKAARLDRQRAPLPGENGAASGDVAPEVAAVAAVGERRTTSVALRVATAVLSLVSFSLMASARTSGWAGDHYGRYQQYRYAVGVNVVVCIYSIAQAFGEIRRLVSPRFIFRSTSSYYFSLFLDQASPVLAYLLMSASSAAASQNDLWVSRFGKDPFNKKINSAVWLSFIAFITLAANSLISTANLFSMI